MKTIINNIPVELITDQFVQFMDGMNLFVGVTDVNKEIFVPFYCVGGHYTRGYIFNSEETMEIHDANDQLDTELRPAYTIQRQFNRHLADHPGAVTNVDLFKKIIKAALIRENRRVSWCGTGEHGTVMKIDNQEIQVLWDAHKGVPQPTIDYAVTDETVQPVLTN